ncbi:MAG TPA: D-erythronate dehydrogenase [Streptosporangiaceae bacterium]|nr:D-erythronate dehydrogenase [Streptosporangiaceae bacterium]
MTDESLNVVITGGAGFIGTRLAAEILTRGSVAPAGTPSRPVARLTLVDHVAPAARLGQDPRVAVCQGDLVAALDAGAGPLADADVVFHLAAAVSAECERDFDLGMRANVTGTQAVLAACRLTGRTPVVVFASSLAVFGGTDSHPLPDVVTDSTLPVPQSSYGTQKLIGEQLVADYTRKGFILGRSVRLMTVTVRPGRPNGAASGFLSGIIREPLAGLRANAPVPADTAVALSSPARAVEGLLCAAEAAPPRWGDPTAVNLPSVTVTVGEMVRTLERVAGPAVSALVGWESDEAIAAIVRSWPARFATTRAAALGLRPDDGFEAIVRTYLRDTAG